MTIHQHAIAVASIVFLTLHLSAWCVVLLLLALARLLLPGQADRVRRLAERVYHGAVRIDDWWLARVVGIRWAPPPLDLDARSVAVVVCNHRSWADIFFVQSTVCRHGPIVKFLAKRELIYIPIFGIIVFMFDFPVLRRRASGKQSEPERRDADRQRVLEAAMSLRESPAALLSFVEGTRFTPDKHQRLKSPFKHLLPPRHGGFSAIVAAVRESHATIVDLTLSYTPDVSFWQLLGGVATTIEIHATSTPVAQIADDPRSWLWQRWAEKDQLLAG